MQAKIVDSEREQKKLADRISAYESAVAAFVQRYGKFAPETDDVLLEIAAKTSSCAELSAAVRQLEKQKLKASSDQQASRTQSHEQETELKEEISRLEQRRDALRDEYTHKSDLIRQADQSLEKYPDVTQEIHNLYEQKQKAQNTVSMLKRTIFLITKAKESLADRYLSKVEQLFNSYMQLWLGNDTVRGILDIDATIYCEKASHKGILIGKNGAMLRKIGSEARADMEAFLGAKVFLQTWIKVKENWRDSDVMLRNFGYRND